MIETVTLAIVAVAFSLLNRDTTKPQPHRVPGLSSQAAQIKPLTPAQIALGKKAYLGPSRKRDPDFYRNRRVKKALRKLPF